jgi:hypothetical protein
MASQKHVEIMISRQTQNGIRFNAQRYDIPLARTKLPKARTVPCTVQTEQAVLG